MNDIKTVSLNTPGSAGGRAIAWSDDDMDLECASFDRIAAEIKKARQAIPATKPVATELAIARQVTTKPFAPTAEMRRIAEREKKDYLDYLRTKAEAANRTASQKAIWNQVTLRDQPR